MKNSIRPPRSSALALTLTLAGALSTAESAPAAAVQEKRTATLELAKRTFTKLDANKDGKLSLTEAGRTGVPAKAFNAQDADADKHLSQSEFILLYRELLASSGYPIASDLDQAAKGIQADRRKAAEEQRVQAARKKQADLDAKRTQEAREKQAKESAEARTTAARKKQADLDAKRIQEAREKQAAGDESADAKKPTPVPTKPKKVKKPRKPEDGAPPPSKGNSKGRPTSGGSDGR